MPIDQPGDQLTYRLAEAGDAAFLREMSDDFYRARFEQLNLPEAALRQLFDLQYRAQLSSYAARFPQAEQRIYTLTQETAAAKPVGQALISCGPDAFHLIRLALTSPYRGRGLGTSIMTALLAEAAAQGLPMRLEVEPGNPAEGLYRRLGFVVTAADLTSISMEHAASE